MKKALLTIASILFFTAQSFAGSGESERIFDAVALSGTGTTVTSRIFNVSSVYRAGYWFKSAKAATPEGSAVRMTIEGSYDDTVGNFATMQTLMPSNVFTTTISPVATSGTISAMDMKYVRFVAEGLTGNSTGTTVTAYLFTQDQN